MSTAPRQLVDCKPPPPTSVDTPAAVYADSATGTGNGNYPDDVREMHKYYWGDGRPAVGKDAPPPLGDRLPPELRHDDYSPATGSGRLPSKLMSYGLPVCGDAGAAAKLLTNAPPPAAGDYYQTSPGYVAHGDCAAYGYGPSHDMASMMAAGGYHQQTAVGGGGYTCQRMTSSSSPAQFGDVKAGMITPANTAELYQWVREQQNFACTAANAIGIYCSDNHCL